MEYGRVHTDGSRSGGQKPVDVVEKVARALCAASSESWRTGVYLANYDADTLNNHWRYKARAAIAAMLEVVEEPVAFRYGGDIGKPVFFEKRRPSLASVGATETPLYSLSPLLAAVEKD